jgi:hypothetical protein
LRPKGWLLISVPYLSPLRQAVALAGTRDWFVRQPSIDTPDGGEPKQFYQYVFTKREFQRLSRERDLRLSALAGTPVWGLYDLPGAERVVLACSDAGRAMDHPPMCCQRAQSVMDLSINL